MKIITSFVKKLFILIISSLVTASLWIGVETASQPADNTRCIELQKKIDAIGRQILILETDIFNRPERGLKKYLHKTQNFLTRNQIKDLQIRKITLSGHLKELQLKNTLGWDKFVANWHIHIFEYALYIFILLAFLPLAVSLLTYFVIAYLIEKSPVVTALKKGPETLNINMKK